MKYFFPRVLNKIGLLHRINIFPKLQIKKKSIIIPVINKIGYNNLFLSEMWMIRLLESVLPLAKGSFVDIGVNLGQSLIKLRSLDQKRQYIGFEPNPSCVFYVEKLIKVNSFENTLVIPVGLSDKTDVLHLNLYSENNSVDSSGSIIKDFRDQKVFK